MRRRTVLALTTLLASAVACDGGDDPLPRLVTLPSFELVDQRGEPFRASDMRGQVWIADFVFTHCPTICPRLSARMAELQDRFSDRRGELRLVSFSVDPENDTPDVLREYGERYEADPAMWTWVTGPTGEVSHTVVNGFRLAMGEPTPTADGEGYDIMHAAKLVLVDRDGVIRGYYDLDDDSMARLVRDAERLLATEEGA